MRSLLLALCEPIIDKFFAWLVSADYNLYDDLWEDDDWFLD